MKVLVAQKVVAIAGSETYLLNLLPALNKNGIQADFLILFPKGQEADIKKFEARLLLEQVNVFKVPVGRIPSWGELKEVYEVIKSGQYDILHSNLLDADMIFASIKMLYNRKLVIVSGKHGYQESYNNAYGFDPSKRKLNFYWICAKFAEFFINRSYAISEGLYKLYTGLGICKRDKLTLLHYGFDFDDHFEFQERFRFGSPQLVIVGRLTEFKGHRFAILALKILVKRYPSIKLVIVGWGELKNELEELAAKMQLQENIIFTGFHDKPRDIMYTSDIVLLPSVSEGFGIVVLEAMSVKRPVVAFNVPSPSEIFQHRRTGLLAQPYSVEEYADLISELIESKNLREELASNAYIQLKELYTLDRMTSETIDLYKKVLGEINGINIL